MYIFLLLFGSVSFDESARNYLDQGLELKAQLEKEKRSDLIRKYVFLLIDHHVKHVGYRSFALSNLSKSERIEVRRAEKNFVSNDYTQLIETNLEALLLEKSLRFPDDFDIQISIAYYLHFANGQMVKPQLKMAETQIWELFEKAIKTGISTPIMKSQLVLHLLERGETLSDEQITWAESAYTDLSNRPETIYCLLATRVQQQKHQDVLKLSKLLFEQSYAAKYRLFALVSRSDALFELERFPEALQTVQALLRLAPNHFPSWKKGFDLLLAGPDQDALNNWLDLWILSRPADPARVMTVLEGLGQDPKVHAYFKSFEGKLDEHKHPHIGWFQLATYARWAGQKENALQYLKRASELTPTDQAGFQQVIQEATKMLKSEG